MMKNIGIKIKDMSEMTYKNSISEKRGFPVSAFFWDNKTRKIGSAINTKAIDYDLGNHEGHSERIILNKINLKNAGDRKIKVLIVLPPCKICVDFVDNITDNIRFYYLTDIRDKMKKQYTKKLEISKLDNKVNFEVNTRIQIAYLIFKVNSAVLKHKGFSREDRSRIKKDSKEQLDLINYLTNKHNYLVTEFTQKIISNIKK